jgi:hypothetical protein
MENVHLLRWYVLLIPLTRLQLTNFPGFNLLFIPLIYFFYPETQNLTLEQIDKLFTGEKTLLHWKPSMDDTEVPNDDLKAAFAEKTEIKHIEKGGE